MPLAALVFNLALRQPAACPSAAPGDVLVCGRRDVPAPDNVIPIRVNGQPGTMLVDPGGPRRPACNPDFAIRARFRGQGPVPIGHVGPIPVEGWFGRIAFDGPGWHGDDHAVWSARPAVAGADCWVGPAALGARRVTFRIGPARADAVTAGFRLYRGGDTDDSSDARVDLGGWSLQVRFDALRDPTALSASATLAVAPVLGASVEGPAAWSEIWYGIRRPIRHLAVREPLAVGPLVLDRLYARVADYGDARGVQSVNGDELDPGDVVVTGHRLRPGRSRIVRVGRSDLARCSEISFDFHDNRVLLTC